MIATVFKVFAVVVVALATLFFIATNYSVSRSVMRCDGELHKDGEAVPGTVYLAIEKFRWWVHLWSDADGVLHVEMPDGYELYYNKLETVSTGWHILDGYGDKIEMKGMYSELSKTLRLDTPFGTFEGTCAATP